jgi:hypothetical protein
VLAWSSTGARAAAPIEPSEITGASASPERDATAEVLRVEVAAALDDAALLPGWITERHPDLARAVRDPEGRHAQWITVEISGSTYDFRVSVTAMRDGEPLRERVEPTRCECTTEELLALVDVGIAAALEQLRRPAPSEPALEHAPESAATEVAPSLRAEPAAPIRAPRPLEGRSRRLGSLGPLGHAGIGASVAGVGLVTVGAVLARRPEEVRGAPGGVETREFRSSGIGLAVTGGVMLATGIGLLVVDLAAPRRRTTALVPMGGPRMAGAWLVRRF